MRADWRAGTTLEIERLRAEVPSAPSSNEQEIAHHAAKLLDAAEKSLAQPWSLREWWTGARSLLALLQVHEAEAELAATLPDVAALVALPQALADARRDIGDDDDPAVREATSLYFEAYPSGSSVGRPAHRQAPQVLSQLLRRRYDAVYKRQAQSLRFRNVTIGTIGVILVALLAVFWVAADARLPWSPQSHVATASTFPSAWLTTLCVIVFGVLGGLISALPQLGRAPTGPDPYGLTVSKAALKPAVGGLLAVVGCVALQSGTLPGVTGVTSLAGLLFWAAAFGASQQAVTRLLDTQVGNLLRQPGEATVPRSPLTAPDLGASSTDGTSPAPPRQTYERGHAVESVQTTATGTRRELLSERESRSVTQDLGRTTQ